MTELLRFVLVGGLNTLIGYAIYLAFLMVGFRPEVALAIAIGSGAIVNYFTYGRLTFRYRSANRLVRYLLAYGAIYGLNVLLIRLVMSYGIGPALAQAFVLPVIAVVMFAVLKRVIFARPAQ